MKKRLYLVGLTGNIACGKSTVLQELQRLGAATLDADAVAHEVMRSGTAVYEDVVAAFGSAIVAPDGEIDRAALGQVVFADPQSLARLEAIVHPAVLACTWEWLDHIRAEVAVVDAIKLIEAGMAEHCDEVWVVVCRQGQQVRRLMTCRGLSRQEALKRIRAQPAQEEKISRADVVIDNCGRLGQTLAQVHREWDALQRRRRQRATPVD